MPLPRSLTLVTEREELADLVTRLRTLIRRQ
jgi:hypothetical protein